jgi:hypothetical protein
MDAPGMVAGGLNGFRRRLNALTIHCLLSFLEASVT